MKEFFAGLLLCLSSTAVLAQFVGPEAAARTGTVQQALDSRLGTYITVTGNIVSHQREDYFLFRDSTGEIRVEIEPPLWAGRKVDATTQVRLVGEVDHGSAGRYLWVKSLDLVD